jgi:predicted nucleotidyltransferase
VGARLPSLEHPCEHAINAAVSLIEPIIRALEDAQVRYVVVGGLATVLHGYPRLTVDIDLVVDLAPEEALKAVGVLTSLGLVPRVPVAASDFAARDKRESWVRDKNMRVFTMLDPRNPMRQVDLFVESPIPFEVLWRRSELLLLEGTSVRIAAIEDLVTMKRIAARPQDLKDIEALLAIAARKRR